MKYGERLRLAREHKGLTQDELALVSGVKQGTISKIERGGQNSSGFDAELSYAVNVHAMWLKTGDKKFTPDWITGEGKKHLNYLEESNAEYAPELGRYRQIPIVGIAQLGDNGHWCEIDYPTGYGDGYINYPSKDAQAYALRCIGDSMKPRIRNGEFVIVEPNSEAISGDEVLVKANDGRVMVKILLYKRDGRVYLQSLNEAHPSLSIKLDDIAVIHPIAAIVKSMLWNKNP